MSKLKNQLSVLTLLCTVVLAGCATRADIDALRSEIQDLQQSSSESLKLSQEARDIASNNRSELASIKLAAESAELQAQQANDKVDRVFETSVRK